MESLKVGLTLVFQAFVKVFVEGLVEESRRVFRSRLEAVCSANSKDPDLRSGLMKLAVEHCTNPTVLKWLRQNSESNTFVKLVKLFRFLKEHIDEEEKKMHFNTVDITFLAHGCIRDFLLPACCLLPLPSITDVVLYAPWNCVSSGLDYAIATGRIKPQHRVFYCTETNGCKLPDAEHRPRKLPDGWNHMKDAGEQMIPNISVSPLRPDDGVWTRFETLRETHGPLGRNRFAVPFILPGEENESVPFSVVTLALSLVLLGSRFTATVHLDTCLGDQSAAGGFDRKYLEKQYACAVDGTGIKASLDMSCSVS